MIDWSSKIKGCIFNLDGVIVDTAKYHYIAWRRLSNEMGFDFSPEQHETLRGLSRTASLERILEWGGIYMTEAEKLHWSDVKNNWYRALIANMTPGEVLPGALPFLQQVQAAGKRIALSSDSKNARSVLRSTAVEFLFEAVLDGNDIRKSKPHPECFLLAATALGLAPDECLVFEDAAVGVAAGLAGGFPVVGIGEAQYLPKARTVIPGFQGISFQCLLNQLQRPEINRLATIS
ncbi:MAG: beta-phosphoglucomutase [Saprospiraceae bacterium]